jgi:hypothetical protein
LGPTAQGPTGPEQRPEPLGLALAPEPLAQEPLAQELEPQAREFSHPNSNMRQRQAQ